MSHFIVEHKVKGRYVMDTLHGVEDIDTAMFKNIIGIWVCETMQECNVMEKELREMRHAATS